MQADDSNGHYTPVVIIFGVDLSGPANVAGTAVVSFREQGDYLEVLQAVANVADKPLIDVCSQTAAEESAVVGLDAPLSYNPGGGDRPADSELRKLVMQRGLPSGSVMTPTTTRMVYLTLRGFAVARALSPLAKVVEVHPSGALVLRGATVRDVREMKRSRAARQRLLTWLETQGLRGAAGLAEASDHVVAACAAALAAWGWAQGRSAWVCRASPPAHPYDFAC